MPSAAVGTHDSLLKQENLRGTNKGGVEIVHSRQGMTVRSFRDVTKTIQIGLALLSQTFALKSGK